MLLLSLTRCTEILQLKGKITLGRFDKRNTWEDLVAAQADVMRLAF